MSRCVLLSLWCVPMLLLLCGCSTRFEREWKNAAAVPKKDAFAGRWEGNWRSAKHRNAEGKLRGIITPVFPNRYRANFKANWMVFTSTYSVDFEVQRKHGGISFSGAKNLGAIYGGVYTFEGSATPERFTASYDSSYDKGTFEMSRPGQQPLR